MWRRNSAGNTSPEAKVTIQIQKPDTKVDYADLEGHPAHKAALRLAEEDIFVGEYRNGQYFFDPDQPVSRAEFLSLAMAAAGLEPLEDVSLTGFSDDSAIPTWAMGCVSAALQAGVIQGSRDESGAPVFGAEEDVTYGRGHGDAQQPAGRGPTCPWRCSPPRAASPTGPVSRRHLAASGVLRQEDAGAGGQPHPGRRGGAAGRRPGCGGRPGGRRVVPLVGL